MPTNSDIIIDVFAGVFFLGVILHSLYALWDSRDRGMSRTKITLMFFIGAGCVYMFQLWHELATGHFAPPRGWDVLNFVQAVGTLMAVQIINKMTGHHIRTKHPNARSLGGII